MIALEAMGAGRLQQHIGAADVGLEELVRLHQRAIDVGRGREVDDGVDLMIAHGLIDRGRIADVALHKCQSIFGQTIEVCAVAGVG